MFILGRLFSYVAVRAIYIIAAVLPALALLVYVYKKDKIEREPVGLIVKLLGFGVLAAVCSVVLESAGTAVLNLLTGADTWQMRVTETTYYALYAFLVIAVIEEGTKIFFLRKGTWRNANFTHLFDAVVYAASVSLGFAAIENVFYIFGYGLSVAGARALLAVPAHLGFSVFMGVFYGRAKQYELLGDKKKARDLQILAYVSAVLLHGFYDACAMIGSADADLMFILFVIAMDVAAFFIIRKTSRKDRPLV